MTTLTPRVDAAAGFILDVSATLPQEFTLDSSGDYVPAEFARQLETELAHSTNEVACLKEAIGPLENSVGELAATCIERVEKIAKLETELADALRANESLAGIVTTTGSTINALKDKLTAANALLREAKIMLIRTTFYVPASATSKTDFTDGKPIEECRTKDRAHATIDRIAAHLEASK